MIFHDIEELISHWKHYAKTTDKKSLQNFKNAMALGQTYPLTPHKGVTLSTVHTMKGQEFDIVFLIGAYDGTFPDYRAIKQGGAALAQEKNNLYVAMSRAKRFLYITWPQQRTTRWGNTRTRQVSNLLEPLRGKFF